MAGFETTAILITIAIAALVAAPGLLASRGGSLGRIFKDFARPPGAPGTVTQSIAAPQSPNARFCTECGSALSANAAFCTQCGARL